MKQTCYVGQWHESYHENYIQDRKKLCYEVRNCSLKKMDYLDSFYEDVHFILSRCV